MDDEEFSASEYLASALPEMGNVEWTRNSVIRLLEELATAHWEDCGDELGGFAVAYNALQIAVAADDHSLGDDDRIRRVLHHVGYMAGYLCDTVEDPALESALAVIEQETRPWRWAKFPGALGAPVIPGVNDAASASIN